MTTLLIDPALTGDDLRQRLYDGKESQARLGAVDHHPDQELVVLSAPGEVLLFSGAQLHTSIPNTSGRARFSVDFRTVNVPDLLVGRGVPLVDVNCTGTAIRNFMNVADEHPFEEQTVVDLFGPPPADAMLVFNAPGADAHSTPSWSHSWL